MLHFDGADPDGVLADAQRSLTAGFVDRFAADLERRSRAPDSSGLEARSRARAAGIGAVTSGGVEVLVIVQELRSTTGGPMTSVDRAVVLTMVSRGRKWLVDEVSDPS